MFILDTDHLGILQRQSQPDYGRLVPRLGLHPETAFFVTIVSFHEQTLGWHAYLNQGKSTADVVRGYERLQRILADFSAAQVLPFSPSAAVIFDGLQSQRVRVGTMDLRIAAIALDRGMIVLTRNLRDFQRVPGLTVEDWTRGP